MRSQRKLARIIRKTILHAPQVSFQVFKVLKDDRPTLARKYFSPFLKAELSYLSHRFDGKRQGQTSRVSYSFWTTEK